MNINKIYTNSYQRILDCEYSNHSFFEVFYRHFINRSPEIRAKFSNTNFEHQKTMLKNSLVYLQGYYETGKASDYLLGLVKRHGPGDLNIPSEMYDQWLESFLLAVKECDPKWSPKVQTAWQAVLRPGIELMRNCQ